MVDVGIKKKNSFQPAWWLANKHLQSCYSTIIPYRATTPLRWEELDLPDGDFIDIVWAGPENAPMVLLLHGLEGSINSHYIQLMLDVLVNEGWQVVVMHHRSCSGRLNRLPQGYNGGDTRDLVYLITQLRERHSELPLYAVGFSLGGNVLLHYLSQCPDAEISAAIAVSTPYEMGKSADFLAQFYQRNLLRTMKQKVIDKINNGLLMPVSIDELRPISLMRQFDARVTAPLYDFPSVEDYYHAVSCRPVLKKIKRPALILHSLDDPFVPEETVPDVSELSPSITLEISEKGGHVGFIEGSLPWRPSYWLRRRILDFLPSLSK